MKTAPIRLPLTNGGVALIDSEDAYLAAFKWALTRYKNRPPYVIQTNWHRGDEVPRELHRAVLRPPARVPVDHRSGDTLDNRRDNLRLGSGGVNNRNVEGANRNSQSGVRGVTWHARSGKWQAVIRVDGKLRYLGVFECIDDARRARATAETSLWGVHPRRAKELAAFGAAAA